MTHSEPRTAEALLAETAWLHALARRLVGGADGAQDAVQETLMTAARSAPAGEARRRGWLAVVLQNHLRLRGRSQARRRAREQVAAARQGPAPAAVEVVAAMDAAQRVLDAVRSLEEPYHTTIVLRFLEELAPREVARRTGVPVKTAQTRIERGLEHLRRRLDRSAAGGREAWLSALAPLARPGDGPGIVEGVITMGSRWKQGAALAALVLALGAGTWLVMGEGRRKAAPQELSEAGLEVPEPPYVDRDSDGARVGLGAVPENGSTARSDLSREDGSAGQGPAPVVRAGRVATRPPSTVRLGGGATLIGSTPEEVQELVLDDSTLNRFLRVLDAETPRFSLALDPFHMGVTEVTNEQYAVFVRATGQRPPSGWGSPEVIDEAQRAFVNEDAEARRAAQTGGAQAGGGRAARRRMFARDAWWSDHWEEAPWEVPEGADREPVLHVDHADAEAYCEWAGLRLPTEFEYQHACRGTSDSRYPWGDDWADGRPPAGEFQSETSVADVAGTAEGVTFQGIHDLAGNVWEWTASAYTPYPGFERKTYEVWVDEDGRAVLRPTTPEPRWDAARRVVAGGSFLNSPLASRCTTRRPTDRAQRTNALGFRVAAAVRAGVDVARRIVRDLEESPVVPAGVTYAPDRTVGLDRWWVVDGAAGAPARYQVVAGYEHLLFVPVESIEIEVEDPVDRKTQAAPRHLGFLSTSVALTDPALPAGVYLLVLAEGLVLLDAGTGAIAGRLSARTETLAEADGESEIDLARPWLRLSLEVPLTGPGRVLRVALDLRPEAGFWDGAWRH